MLGRRFISVGLFGALSISLLFSLLHRGRWRYLPQSIGLGEAYGPSQEDIASGINILPDLRPADFFKEPKIDSMSPYPIGRTKPAGSNYTRRLVIAKTKSENTSWIHEQLGDVIATGLLQPTIYTVNDQLAELRVPRNKGHEVMVYLSYLIDFYDDLPDISIFMHAHPEAWHNNEILDLDAAQMIRHLSPERVTREGYMNLRCHWEPGCPDWIHPGSTVRDPEKLEEVLIAETWTQMFPEDAIPTVLAQPCCAQFALSKERILQLPKARYVYLRDWLLQTPLSDYLSGRMFEYTWQYIFTASPVHCPSMSACYCDGYGFCFGDAQAFDAWFELRYNLNERIDELHEWQRNANLIQVWRQKASEGHLVDEEAPLHIPQIGRDKTLRREIDQMMQELDDLKAAAFERGKNPWQRAMESGRDWMVGDGY